MFGLVLVFVLCLLLPLYAMLGLRRADMFLDIVAGLGGLLALAIAARMLASWRASRAHAAGAAASGPVALFENECARRLESLGWEARHTQPAGSDRIYLQATRPGARALILCEPHGDRLTSLALRTLAMTAGQNEAAAAAVVQGAVLAPALQAAAKAGVAVLQPAHLDRLAEWVGGGQPAAAEATPPPP